MAFCDVDVLKVAVSRPELSFPVHQRKMKLLCLSLLLFLVFVFGFFIFVVHLGTLEWKGLLENENLRVVNHSVQFSQVSSVGLSVNPVKSFILSSEMIAGLG